MSYAQTLGEHEAPMESFHDCSVVGVRWRAGRFDLTLDVQYIVKWIAPDAGAGAPGYRFSISAAQLAFQHASDVSISFAWTALGSAAQIDTIRCGEPRPTPNGKLEARFFELDFSEPDASLSLWSTGYTLRLLHEPIETEVPYLEDGTK